MRWLVLCLGLLPNALTAGLLDMLPLARIERNMLYPFHKATMAQGAAARAGMTERVVMAGKIKLIVWTHPPRDMDGPVLLYFHGNAGTLETRSERFALLKEQGFGIIAPAYRGSSGSGGTPNEATLIADAVSLYRALPQVLSGAKPARTILYGESLGTAVAIAVMQTLPDAERPAGIILEAPFTSIPDMARAVTDVPPNLIARIKDTWRSEARARQALSAPLLVIHGTRDEVTPFSMGRRIHDAAPSGEKEFIPVQGALHAGTWTASVQKRMWQFMRRHGQ